MQRAPSLRDSVRTSSLQQTPSAPAAAETPPPSFAISLAGEGALIRCPRLPRAPQCVMRSMYPACHATYRNLNVTLGDRPASLLQIKCFRRRRPGPCLVQTQSCCRGLATPGPQTVLHNPTPHPPLPPTRQISPPICLSSPSTRRCLTF